MLLLFGELILWELIWWQLTLWGLILWHHIFFYVHTGSPNVTGLTFDGTLTCTSTGGPATTVTWRRDGVLITLNATYQQTKRLVDNVTSTYQTVLTIDPSVGWSKIAVTYNCTVENDRGKSSETVVVRGETWTLLFSFPTTVVYIIVLWKSAHSLKNAHPLLLGQFPVKDQSLLKWVPSLKRSVVLVN